MLKESKLAVKLSTFNTWPRRKEVVKKFQWLATVPSL